MLKCCMYNRKTDTHCPNPAISDLIVYCNLHYYYYWPKYHGFKKIKETKAEQMDVWWK